ncbi:PREDICTED: uncharacterized protein LOC105984741 [Dipodomys ordii]|uniref:Uncharacterized protein LOC105984741 n=1 Tax=Dipodomys ordii TaxID=10020 RepID=A0A1S3F2M7_DIPOR|nr:PREDICTED: uncharacterized protein LOC105984741 [Dipodomys ordii]
MTELLRSVVTIIDIFYKYTKQDEECGTLSKDELKELLEKEFRPILKNPDDPDTVDVIMHMLDRDHDRRLDFTEFLLMVFKLAMACNKVLSKEYCKASGSKKRRRGHQHQKEESETEEESPGPKSGYRHSSWSEGEEQGYSSRGSRGTGKHRYGSNSRRLGRQSELPSSEGSEKSHYRSQSGHSWSSGKDRHGFRSGETGERRNKSHSPSRESGEEYESGSKSSSQGQKGLSQGLKTSEHKSNSSQSKKSGGQKHESSSTSSGNCGRQSHACSYDNSGGCGRPQNTSSSCQAGGFRGQANQSSCTQSCCQSGGHQRQGYGCVSGGQSSGCCQPQPSSCSQSSGQRGHGSRQCGQPQSCGRQQGRSSSQSSCCGQHGSGASQSSSYGPHRSGSCRDSSNCHQKGSSSNEFSKCSQYGSGSGYEQPKTGSSKSSGFGQHGSGSGQSCCGQHGYASSQSSGYGQHGCSSGQSSGFGQHGPGSGQSCCGQQGYASSQSSGYGQHGCSSGQSSGFGQHGSSPSQSTGFGQHGSSSGQSSGLGQHGSSSGQSSGLGQHGSSSGQSSGFGQHGSSSGQSSGFGQHGSSSGQSSGFGQHGSSSGQSSGFGQHGSGSGQSSGLGWHRSSSGQSSGVGQQGSSTSQSSGFGQHGSSSGQSSGLGQHGSSSGQSSGLGQHGSSSGQSSGLGQHGSSSGQSSGLGQHGSSSGQSSGLGQHGSSSGQSSGFGQHGSSSGQSSGLGQHGSSSGQSSGFGQHGSSSGQSSGLGQHGSSSSQSSGLGQHGSSSGQSLASMGLALVSPLVLASMGLALVSPLVLASMGLTLVSPLVLASMGLTLVSPLALAGMGLARVSLLELGNKDLAPISPLVLASMGLALVSPLALASMGLALVSHLDLGSMALAPGTMVQALDSILDSVNKGLDLTMVSMGGHQKRRQDSCHKNNREYLMDKQKTQQRRLRQGMDRFQSLNQAELLGEHPCTVSLLTVKSNQVSHTIRVVPLRARVNLKVNSPHLLDKKESKLLMASREMPGDRANSRMNDPNILAPVHPLEGHILTANQVTQRNIQNSHTIREDPPRARVNLKVNSPHLLGKEDSKVLMTSQEMPGDRASSLIDNPNSPVPDHLLEGHLLTASQVIEKDIHDSHTHNQNPLRTKEDLHREGLDPHNNAGRELLMDRPEIPQDSPNLGMARLQSLIPEEPPGEHPCTVSLLTVKSNQVPHTIREDLLKARVNLKVNSPHLLGKEDSKLLTVSQEMPGDRASSHMVNPNKYDYGQSGFGPSGGSRNSSRNPSPLRSSDRGANTQKSGHTQSFSLSDSAASESSELTGRLVPTYEHSEIYHGHSFDSQNQLESSIVQRQISSHVFSVVPPRELNDTEEHNLTRNQQSTHSLSSDYFESGHRPSIAHHGHSESTSTRKKCGFSTNERQGYSCDQQSDSYEISREKKSQGSSSIHFLYNEDPMENEEYKNMYLSRSATTFGEKSQRKELGFNAAGRMVQHVDKQARGSETRGFYGITVDFDMSEELLPLGAINDKEVNIIINHERPAKDNKIETMSKEELKELLEKEFRAILRNPDDPDTADVFMQILDVDHNDEIDFTEFLLMVLKLAQAYYDSTKKGNLKTAGLKHRRHTHKKEEAEEETDDEEEGTFRRRTSSQSTSNERKVRRKPSRSPSGKGGRHGTSSDRQGGKSQRGKGELHKSQQDSTRKEKRRSHSNDSRNRKHKKSRNQTHDRDENENVYAEWQEPYYTDSYYTEEEEEQLGSRAEKPQSYRGQLDNSADRQPGSSQRQARHSPRGPQESHHREQSGDRPGHPRDRPVQSPSRPERHHQPSVSQDSESEGHPEDSARRPSSAPARSGPSTRQPHRPSAGQTPDRVRHSGSHNRQPEAHEQPDGAPGQPGSRRREQQASRPRQEADSHRQPGAGHRHPAPEPREHRRQGSSFSQASDSEGHSEDSEGHSLSAQHGSGASRGHCQQATQARSGERSENSGPYLYHTYYDEHSDSAPRQHRSATPAARESHREQARDGSRHHDSQESHRFPGTARESHREQARDGSRHHDSQESHRFPGSEAEASQRRPRASSQAGPRSGHEQAQDSERRSGSRQHHEDSRARSESAQGRPGSRGASSPRSGRDQSRDSALHSQESEKSGNPPGRDFSTGVNEDSEGSVHSYSEVEQPLSRSGHRFLSIHGQSSVGWKHGSYGSADYEYGRSGFGKSNSGHVFPTACPLDVDIVGNSKKGPKFGSEHMRTNMSVKIITFLGVVALKMTTISALHPSTDLQEEASLVAEGGSFPETEEKRELPQRETTSLPDSCLGLVDYID